MTFQPPLVFYILLLSVVTPLAANPKPPSCQSSTQFLRFLPHLQTLEDIIATGIAGQHAKSFLSKGEVFEDLSESPEDEADRVIHALIENDTRRAIFHIQGLLRIYDKTYSLEELKQLAKGLEESIGKFKARLDFYRKGQKLQAPLGVQDQLRQKAWETYLELKTVLQTHWMRPTIQNYRALSLLSDSLQADSSSLSWGDHKTDRRDVLRALISEVEELRKLRFDMSKLDDGLHEFRRKIRWLLIYIAAFGKREGQEGLIELLEDSETPARREKIFFPLQTYLRLNEANNRLGDIKNLQEEAHAIEMAYLLSGIAADAHSAREKTRRLFARRAPSRNLVQANTEEAERIRLDIQDSGLLENLWRYLKEQSLL